MNPRTATATFFFLTAVLATLAAATTRARSDDALALGIGRVSVVHSKESIATVAVGDPTIADVAMEGESSVMVFGKRAGETDLVLMNAAHRPITTTHIMVGTGLSPDVIVVRRPTNGGMTDEAWFCAPACVKVTSGAPGK